MVYDSPKPARDPQDIDFKENNSASHGFARNQTQPATAPVARNKYRVSPTPKTDIQEKESQRVKPARINKKDGAGRNDKK